MDDPSTNYAKSKLAKISAVALTEALEAGNSYLHNLPTCH